MQENNVELFTAIAKAQGAMRSVSKDREVNGTYSFKYATLSAIWDVIRGPLTSNGLSVIQLSTIGDRRVFVETRLLHSSGESIVSTIEMPVDKPTPQGYGSAISYARRYALSSILGVVSDDDDDDGVEASGQVAAVVTVPAKPKPQPPPPPAKTPTPAPAPVAAPPVTPAPALTPSQYRLSLTQDEQETFALADALCRCTTRAQMDPFKPKIQALKVTEHKTNIMTRTWGAVSKIMNPPPGWVDCGLDAETRIKYPLRGYMVPSDFTADGF